MLFTEIRFLFFFVAIFVVYWSLTSFQRQKWLLLLASYLFYAAWDWRFLSLIWLSTVVDFYVGKRLEANASHRKRWLGTSVFVNLGILGLFKYFNFFADSAVQFAQLLGLPISEVTLQLVLPVGISFYTFQTLSYSIDIYRGSLKPCARLLDFSLFVAFFPQLVAGPIERAATFLPQLQTQRQWSEVDLRGASLLFLLGFTKKAVVADNVAPFVDQYFADPSAWNALSAWGATILYAVQIYCDFSGYSDMAIAVAALLGFRLMQNFNAPYLSADTTQFWRRWHMSLSFWLRDYLYISLGGNRRGERRRQFNLMATMVLGGLWHGAAWTFVVWGFLHGLALIVHKHWSRWQGRPVLPKALNVLGTFWWVCLAWIFFRAQSFEEAFITVRAWLLWDSDGTNSFGWWWIPTVAGLGGVHFAAQRMGRHQWWRQLPLGMYALLWGMGLTLAHSLMPTQFKAFLYFQF